MNWHPTEVEVNWLVPTRQSLLSRLKDWGDQESWKEFFDTYWSLIYATATKAGLTDAEAQDVVQETVLSVLKSMPDFKYDGAAGSFKGWLLRLTSWRIVDQMRKRQPNHEYKTQNPAPYPEASNLDEIVAPESLKLETIWEEEWERNLLQAAIARVKKKIDPKLYQIFDCYVVKNWPVRRVVRALNVSPARVYLTKYRVSKLIQQEVERLRTKPL